jgi:hypothetical protein
MKNFPSWHFICMQMSQKLLKQWRRKIEKYEVKKLLWNIFICSKKINKMNSDRRCKDDRVVESKVWGRRRPRGRRREMKMKLFVHGLVAIVKESILELMPDACRFQTSVCHAKQPTNFNLALCFKII